MRPLLLHYYITTRCNARCAFCTIWREPAGADALLDDVRRNLAAAREEGCRFVDFTGGEPLLHKQLPEFLAEAKRRGFITSVTTNCLLFPDRAKELAGLVDLLHFSIDADTAEVHDQLRGKRSFDRVIESIDIALQHRLVPDLLFTYTDDTISAFEGVWRLARRKKLMVILDPVFDPDGGDHVSAATHQKALAFARRRNVYLNRAHLSLRRQGGNHTASPLCHAVDSTIVILPDNTLALPCFHHRREFVALANNPREAFAGTVRRRAIGEQGRYPFCEECHLNCYFDPSYARMRNKLSIQSMTAKLRYAARKYLLYRRPWPFFARHNHRAPGTNPPT
jgi:MoaA/NifB/PqqE/SkfB family radical SAM enzyme